MATPTIEWNSGAKEYGTVSFTDDKDLVVNFYYKSVRDVEKSRDKSMPIFNDVIYIKIMRPGEQLNVIDRPAEAQDSYRFARHWAQFQDKKAQVPEGTPIDLLFPNNPAIADSLRARGVFTIQQCSNLTAHAVDSLGTGGQEYVNRAKKYIEQAASGESYVKIQDELARKEQQIVSQNRQMDEMRQQIAQLTNKVMAMVGQNTDPATGMPRAPGFVPNYDPQSERIASTHVTADLKKK